MKTESDTFEYHGVQVTISRDQNAGDLQYEEVMEIVDRYIKNDKGEFLRKLTIMIDGNEDIELAPTYSAPAIKRIKGVL